MAPVESFWLGLKDPARTRKRQWRGHEVLVEIWVDETDLPWDGDAPLEEGSTGWDATVRVSFDDEVVGNVWAGDSCGGIWISGKNPWRDEYLLSQLGEYEEEALGHLGAAAARAGHFCLNPDCIVQGVMGR